MENLGEASTSSNEDLSVVVGDVISEKMVQEEKQLEQDAIQAENELKQRIMKEEKAHMEEQCYKRLNLLLSRSSIYAQFMAEKLKRDESKEIRKQLKAQKKELVISEGKKRKREMVNESPKKSAAFTVVDAFQKGGTENMKLSNGNVDVCNDENPHELQPSLLTGGVMHPYQMEGFRWLKDLFENGVNGILADEMGLGKTIQTIAFIAFLIEMGVQGPFFVCGPLSTVPNWHAEFQKFAPSIPVEVYHGDKEERKQMREKLKKKVTNKRVSCLPVFITSYAVALIDSPQLKNIPWTLLVVDEGHRIKNFQCKLVTALKLFNTSHRLLLTGTPLQTNLSELWSLLNFILPEIFDDLKVFESWFDISRLTKQEGTDEIVAKEQEKQIVSIIHQILSPFLLRRTKAEVNLKLPPKKELIVYAPLTKLQHEYYTAALNKTIELTVKGSDKDYFAVDVDVNGSRPKRNKTVNFDQVFKELEDETFKIPDDLKLLNVSVAPKPEVSEMFADIKLNVRNISMLLRKICGHPYLISYPLDPMTGGHKIDEGLITNSGKLLVLDLMLPELKKRGHKILLFSQFVSMLDVLVDYLEYRNYPFNFLCGSNSLEERKEEIRNFNESKDSFIFLISTKAGGLGLNLTAADTVIIFDSDWNPQGDLQAQDRCHRIGQSKPVVVYRLVIQNTVDEKIIDIATARRKFEKVIIKKGRFASREVASKQNELSIEELLELLKSSDLSGFVKTNDNCVLSPEELEKLLDRSDMPEFI